MGTAVDGEAGTSASGSYRRPPMLGGAGGRTAYSVYGPPLPQITTSPVVSVVRRHPSSPGRCARRAATGHGMSGARGYAQLPWNQKAAPTSIDSPGGSNRQSAAAACAAAVKSGGAGPRSNAPPTSKKHPRC